MNAFVEQAKLQRATWINDIGVAVMGGAERAERFRELLGQRDLTQGQRKATTKDLTTLAENIRGPQGVAMRRHLDYLAFCKKVGLSPTD